MKPIQFFLSVFAVVSSAQAFALDMNGKTCTRTDGEREGTLVFQNDSSSVVMKSDFGNKSHSYTLQGSELTISLFGGASLTFDVQNNGASLKLVDGQFSGDYDCQ